MATLEVATEWLYRVNDDPGMFATDTYNGVTGKGNGYLITPEGEKSTYVDEFTALGRALVKKASVASTPAAPKTLPISVSAPLLRKMSGTASPITAFTL